MANGASRLFNVIKNTSENTNTKPSEVISMTVKSVNPLVFNRDNQLDITQEFYTLNKSLKPESFHVGDIVIAFMFNEGQEYFIQQNNDQVDENDYNKLENKPKINNVELIGNKTSQDLKLQGEINSNNKLLSDLVIDIGQTNKFMTEAEKLKLENIEQVKILPDGNASLQSYWYNLSNGWYYYSYQTISVTNMPENYGFVNVQSLSDNDFDILFYQQPNGNIYRKSGNSTSITNWIKIYDSRPKFVRLSNQIAVTTGNISLNANINNYNLLIAVVGNVGDGTLSSHIVAPWASQLSADGIFSGWRLNTKYEFSIHTGNGYINGYFTNNTTLNIEKNTSGRQIRVIHGVIL